VAPDPPDLPGAASLLLIGGAPASGKTQLARRLSQRYGAILCSKDALKEILFGTLGTGEALGAARERWSRNLSDASFALMFHLAGLLSPPPPPPPPPPTASRRLLILEGNFRPGEHERALQALRVPIVQILCEASASTRALRLAARAADLTRHPAHHDENVDASAPTPGFLELPGTRLRFDTDSSDGAESGDDTGGTAAVSDESSPALRDLCLTLDALL